MGAAGKKKRKKRTRSAKEVPRASATGSSLPDSSENQNTDSSRDDSSDRPKNIDNIPDPNAQISHGTEDTPSDKASDRAKELKDIPIIHGRRWYLTFGALVTAAASLIAGTYAFVNYVEIAPLNRALVQKNQRLQQTSENIRTLTSDISDLRERLASVTGDKELPSIVRPEDGATVFGSKIVLSWQYNMEPAVDDRQYYIEVFDAQEATSREYNVPAGIRVNFDLERPTGMYFWRVRLGYFNERNHPVPQSKWGHWSRFEVFPSVVKRIRKTGTLRVATKPVAEDDKFVFRDKRGQYAGFEVDLVHWVADGLSDELGTSVNVQFVQRRWAHEKNLLQTVNDGDVDVAVRSITKTLARERKYGNMRFTSGYIPVHQVFVQLEPAGEFPGALGGSVVGVKVDSTNESAADYLRPIFGFKVDTSFENYPDLRKALRDRKIDFALVDNVLIRNFIDEGEVHQLGPVMDEYLAAFNEDRLGMRREEYAMAVHVPGKDDELLKRINSLLETPNGKEFVESLRKKYLQ